MKKVREYLETVKDFDNLISPQSLFLHFLGPESPTKVQKGLEVVKKCKCSFSFDSFFFNLFFVPLGMMTRFSKKKLAKV